MHSSRGVSAQVDLDSFVVAVAVVIAVAETGHVVCVAEIVQTAAGRTVICLTGCDHYLKNKALVLLR